MVKPASVSFTGVKEVSVTRADNKVVDDLAIRFYLGQATHSTSGTRFFSIPTEEGTKYYWLDNDSTGHHSATFQYASDIASRDVWHYMEKKYPGVDPLLYSAEMELEEEERYLSLMWTTLRKLAQVADPQKKTGLLITDPDKRPVDFVRLDYTV